MSTSYESARAACTRALGAGLAELLRPGEVVLVRGELGAGKTTLVRGAAWALGVTEPVTSPTFTIAQRYAGRVPVAHLDAYRLAAPDDEELGLALEAVGEDAVAFVEWPETLLGALPEAAVELTIEPTGGDGRLITLRARDPSVGDALRSLVADLRARHRDPQP